MTMLKKKHGFTLVELIVVLVILAILLALLVPALTGWIEKARDKQILIDARTVYLAIQTLEDEEYGANRNYPTHKHVLDTTGNETQEPGSSCTRATADKVQALADLYRDKSTDDPKHPSSFKSVKWETDANGKIIDFTYVSGTRQVTLDSENGELKCDKAS